MPVLLQQISESCKKEADMELQHFSHGHPLFFMQHHTFASDDDDEPAAVAGCFGCGKAIEGPSYGCDECNYYLHKDCAELELTPQINHPFHPQHLLNLLPKSPYDQSNYWCNFCGEASYTFVYHCDPCRFDLHVHCAVLHLQSYVSVDFPKSLHPHPLFFVHNLNEDINIDCSACEKPLSGTIYHCSDCSYKSNFKLHKECAELPLEIDHPYDRKHPLTLLPKLPTHRDKCSCYLCKIQWGEFVYSCTFCKFELTLDDYFAPKTITSASHEHPWTVLSRPISFICDFCGTPGDRSPYLCVTCELVVHKNCISLPQNIMITRHRHVISHSYSLRQTQLDDCICRICYEEVDTRYGSYHCYAFNCGYISHVHCATDEAIWDGTIIPGDYGDYDESSIEVLDEYLNLITDVVEQTRIEEQMVAIEIKHAFHDHNLRLTFSSSEIIYDSQCDGCMMPISTPFYSCGQCNFFLHKGCAEMPRKKRHSFHKHVLTLTNVEFEYSICYVCSCRHNGFRYKYKCLNKHCKSYFECDIRCILLSDTVEHPSHEHLLYLVHNFKAKCSGCLEELDSHDLACRCVKRCDFTLHTKCASLPLEATYKYDKHPLTLTYFDDSSPSQHYCDLCENERDPNDWFYHCVDCDNSLHSDCALGDLPFMKVGNEFTHYHLHRHPLILVKNTWNCSPCKVCNELCNGQALECKKSECNFCVHWDCRFQDSSVDSDESIQ